MTKFFSKIGYALMPAALALAACSGSGGTEQPALSDEALYSQFADPGVEWRSKPFWSWNGKLEEGELKRQLEIFKEMGMGGAFFHSRVGLQTEYLGDEWFQLTNACADASEKLGMEAWLYDEDRWPSGSAGGAVTRDHPEFRASTLSMIILPAEKLEWNPQDTVVSAFVCDLDGINYSNLVQVKQGDDMSQYAGKTALKFVHKLDRPSEGYNDATYLDVYNPAATQKYIELTHDRYKEECGDRIGTTIKGVFTDEPHRGNLMSSFDGKTSTIPWTANMPQEYEKMFGGDLAADLPKLFLRENGERVSAIKWKFCELTQSLFLHNFAKPQLDWCRENNFIYTGHILHEDCLSNQVTVSGSVMRYYEYMDYPGIDLLCEGNRSYWAAKQLSSAARQLGQKWLLTELYGGTGWQMGFEGHKYVGDWQALFGINVRCPHLSWYTMEGEAKRDYPASISFQSAWWKEYAYVENYFSRLGVMLAQGQPECELLVVNPIESVWSQVSVDAFRGLGPHAPEIHAMERRYFDLFHWLMGSRIDFDYGDEEMMGRLCKVGKDKETGEPVLQFGQATYKAMLIGNMETMRASTLELARQFSKAGGKVIFAGEAPGYVDAEPSAAPAELAQSCIKTDYGKNGVVDAVSSAVLKPVAVRDASGANIEDIFAQVRKDENRWYVVLMSMNRDRSFDDVTVTIPCQGEVSQWDCRSGDVWKIDAAENGGSMVITTSFEPIEEKVYTVSKSYPAFAQQKPQEKLLRKAELPTAFDYELDEPNVCVLDLATWKIDGGQEMPYSEILQIDRQVRSHYGMQWRGGGMLQPWYALLHDPSYQQKVGEIDLVFPFTVKDIPSGSLYLCMERPERFTVKINGKPFELKPEGWHIDNSIKKIALPANMLLRGKNTVEVHCDFSRSVDLEALYIVGDFGVELKGNERILTQLPDKLKTGDISNQGLPFYSGCITYTLDNLPTPGEGEKILLTVDNFGGACIRTDDQVCGWKPYRLDLTAQAKNGGKADVSVIPSRRNTFGPLHALPAIVGAYGPEMWVTSGDMFTLGRYVLLPSGLTEQPEISVVSESL